MSGSENDRNDSRTGDLHVIALEFKDWLHRLSNDSLQTLREEYGCRMSILARQFAPDTVLPGFASSRPIACLRNLALCCRTRIHNPQTSQASYVHMLQIPRPCFPEYFRQILHVSRPACHAQALRSSCEVLDDRVCQLSLRQRTK